MRVIVLLSSLYTGGAEFSTLSFYGWLRSTGYDIKLICCKKAQPSYDPSKLGIQDFQYLQGDSFWKKLKELNSIIDEFKPQIVHSVLFEANILGRFSRLKKKNFVHLESLVNEMYSSFRLADDSSLKGTGCLIS
jgi:hypothetical protein